MSADRDDERGTDRDAIPERTDAVRTNGARTDTVRSAGQPEPAPPTHVSVEERLTVLEQLESWLEVPMQVLGFIWLALLILELTRGLSPLLAALSTLIWIAFIVDFVLRMWLAPHKKEYLEHNWLAAISLAVPALRLLRVVGGAVRFLRVLRYARAARGARLVSVVGSINRGMQALSHSMGRRGLGYVVLLTVIVTFTGAAGMYAFENNLPHGHGLTSYFGALWWTAMIMTTLGSDYWPRTGEGRVLCLMLAIYAFAVWGYITASLATFFVGRDAERNDGPVAGQESIDQLRDEVAGLRQEIRDELRALHAAASPREERGGV